MSYKTRQEVMFPIAKDLEQQLSEAKTKIAEKDAKHRKILEEAKRQAVPEGWQLVPKKPNREMELAAYDEYGVADERLLDCYTAMLEDAPQPSPETDIDQPQRFK